MNTKKRRETAIIYYLLGTAFGLHQVKSRAHRIAKKLNIRDADLCTCALSLESKAKYKSKKTLWMRYRKGIRIA